MDELGGATYKHPIVYDALCRVIFCSSHFQYVIERAEGGCIDSMTDSIYICLGCVVIKAYVDGCCHSCFCNSFMICAMLMTKGITKVDLFIHSFMYEKVSRKACCKQK